MFYIYLTNQINFVLKEIMKVFVLQGLSSYEMHTFTRIQILNWPVFISYKAIFTQKVMNQIIFLKLWYIIEQGELFNFDMATGLGDGKL